MSSPSSSSHQIRPIDIVNSCFETIATEAELGHAPGSLKKLIAELKGSGMEVIRDMMEKDTDELRELRESVGRLYAKVEVLGEEKQELRQLLNEVETAASQGTSLNPVECSICFRAYGNLFHGYCVESLENSLLPETGNCGHSICYDCVESLQSKNCPICREHDSFRDSFRNYLAEELISRHQPGLSSPSAARRRTQRRRQRPGFRITIGNLCLVVMLLMSFPVLMLLVGLVLVPLISFALTISLMLYFTGFSERLVDYLTVFLDRLDDTLQHMTE